MHGQLAPLGAALLLWSAFARGAPAGATESPSAAETSDSKPATVGYGWRVAAIDAAALALGGAALGIALSDSPRDKSSAKLFGLAGLVVYLAGPPILHEVRGNATNAEQSGGCRLGLPFAGFFAGFVVGYLSGHEHSGGPLDFPRATRGVAFGVIGAGVGALAAMVVDATVVAREPVTRTAAWGVVPSFDPHSRSMGLTAVGRFF